RGPYGQPKARRLQRLQVELRPFGSQGKSNQEYPDQDGWRPVSPAHRGQGRPGPHRRQYDRRGPRPQPSYRHPDPQGEDPVTSPQSRVGALLDWLLRLLALCALAGFALATWFAGPMIRYGDVRPFESEWTRAAIIGASLVLVACRLLLRQWQIRRAERKIEEAIARSEAAGSDAEILETRMREAIATLKQQGAGRNFLYELPWYIIIGPPGAGKTTALVNSGLRFPLAAGEEAQAVGGIGGTRNCDWWFTDEAVLIDTAGRYTTQDSDAELDRK